MSTNSLDSVYDYTPDIITTKYGEIYGRVLVELSECASCKCLMLNKEAASKVYNDVFPGAYDINIARQVDRAGWSFTSNLLMNNEVICERCASEGKGRFTCSLCKVERDSSMIKKSFGDPDIADYLCTVCFETVTAKTWDNIYNILYNGHKYDYE